MLTFPLTIFFSDIYIGYIYRKIKLLIDYFILFLVSLSLKFEEAMFYFRLALLLAVCMSTSFAFVPNIHAGMYGRHL